MLIRNNLEFSPRSFVRSSVWKYLEIHSLLFLKLCSQNSERRKNFPSAFIKISRFTRFGQNLSKIVHFGPKCPIMEVFRFFIGIPSLLFTETLQLIRAFNGETNVPNSFLKNTVLFILAKNFPKFAIWLDVCNSLFKG